MKIDTSTYEFISDVEFESELGVVRMVINCTTSDLGYDVVVWELQRLHDQLRKLM